MFQYGSPFVWTAFIRVKFQATNLTVIHSMDAFKPKLFLYEYQRIFITWTLIIVNKKSFSLWIDVVL